MTAKAAQITNFDCDSDDGVSNWEAVCVASPVNIPNKPTDKWLIQRSIRDLGHGRSEIGETVTFRAQDRPY